MNQPTELRLAQALDEVARLQTELDAAQRRIVDLTDELNATNRGLVALHTELEAAHRAETEVRTAHGALAERDRIAYNLQDLVIHRVFGIGLALQGVVGLIHDPHTAERVRTVTGELDNLIVDLRTAIFGRHHHSQAATSIRAQLADLVDQACDKFDIGIVFHGPVDAAVPDHIAAELIDVTREWLAGQTALGAAEITLQATVDELILHITHAGPGGETSDRHAIPERTSPRRGTIDVISGPDGGARFEWRVQLPRR